MPTLPPDFPFTAIVGQHALKTALILNAINPGIGGVLISGPRGSAKSTLARALAAILPVRDNGERPPFVNLPLGTSEDRLIGSLDLKGVLADREVTFQPGLLASADGGVLYVDEVNLLPDTLVDLLLDAAARGVNAVEREGISHRHSARFALIGTMNPDEGELRPQLLDRFGLCLELERSVPVAERVAIVQQREAFERDPDDYCRRFAEDQRALGQGIAEAQARLVSVVTPEWIYPHIAERCEAAGVEGLRADVTWHRAAQAHAAWRGVGEMGLEDLEAVEPWVLAHRRTTPPPESTKPPSGGSRNSGGQGQTSSGRQENGAGDQGQWGAMPPVVQQTEAVDWRPPPGSPPRRVTRQPVATPALRTRKGHQAGQRQTGQTTGKPDWFATLTANRGAWPLRELRFRKARAGQPMLHLVLLDTSGSTLGHRLLGRAKGLVDSLARQAYAAREQITVLTFGNDGVQPVLSRRRSPKVLATQLDSAHGGGGTPLRAAIERAARLIRQWHRREPGLQIRTYLITDGRTRQSLADLPGLGECVVVDTEQSAIKRGRGPQIAEQLGASYQTLPAMEAL
ncbi:VWA domain-containing protein [Marinobacter halodurans]|uniref:VWA domain-containing protein n=1 Tax=Marinobacter halodurans TaxID=2528979 RepID=A0ABY1ZK86_9GAMM|nr:AAA family ATPase [Marinobacter halodurans]TBW50375.1 VWA domain-containing protein [Marinobacter halodurans]